MFSLHVHSEDSEGERYIEAVQCDFHPGFLFEPGTMLPADDLYPVRGVTATYEA